MALYRHVVTGISPGESWSFTLHTEGTASLEAANTAWHDAVVALWTGQLDALVSPDITVTEVSTAELGLDTGMQLTRVIDDVSLPGVATGAMLPFQCAAAVSFRTQFATRWGRGRLYLPPLSADVLSAGRLSASAQGTILAAMQAAFTALQGDGLNPVIWSRTKLTTYPIVSIDVGDVIDTQRRRRNKLVEERVSANV